MPIGYVSQVHLARLTDLAWSDDGKLLMVSSYDGYCTLITIERDEIGEIYMGPMIDFISLAAEAKASAALEKQKSSVEKPKSTTDISIYFAAIPRTKG